MSAGAGGRRELLVWLVGAVVAAALLVAVVVMFGGRVESATWGLVVAAGAMVFALRALYRMALALAQPAVEAVVDEEGTAASAGVRELREERRRVLRAINELTFDYEMGKLNEADYKSVREGYELRAVEVMRALDHDGALHPDLVAELTVRGLMPDADHDGNEPAEPEAEDDAMAKPDPSGDDEVAQQEAPGDDVKSDDERPATEGATCPKCEGENDADAKFCKHCGAGLAVAQGGDQ